MSDTASSNMVKVTIVLQTEIDWSDPDEFGRRLFLLRDNLEDAGFKMDTTTRVMVGDSPHSPVQIADAVKKLKDWE